MKSRTRIEVMAVALVVALVLAFTPSKADSVNKLGKLECEGLTIVDSKGKPRISLQVSNNVAGVWLATADGGQVAIYSQDSHAVVGLYSKKNMSGPAASQGHDIAIVADRDGARLQLLENGKIEIVPVSELITAIKLARKATAEAENAKKAK